MGILSRMLIPRGVRRAMHPVSTAKRAVTLKSVKRARRALHPIDNAIYQATRPRRAVSYWSYRHGACPVRHRTSAAAVNCRNH